ncbi:hypothetical protein [Dyella mobilis]|uniref:Uncharacterized protein n=1 Tax=Dyella mobilis TaxID=1849582 RepID=A0ABS2KB02_9GAMM|nr:hypothetical protein [Dyella mobilis]MBM7128362.1 hypothetical protein [Dyella mobilis]GLQ99666.1 hypothetical protein GCM10007863_40860 [Dyella mobilis]
MKISSRHRRAIVLCSSAIIISGAVTPELFSGDPTKVRCAIAAMVGGLMMVVAGLVLAYRNPNPKQAEKPSAKPEQTGTTVRSP